MCPMAQSELTTHARPTLQRAQLLFPPQSTSVSLPSFLLSKHWFASHVNDCPSQALLVQSLLVWHFSPVAQVLQVPPPQSTSVSAPSCLWSVHRLLTHLDVTKTQALLAQAGLLEQNPPIGAPTQAPLLQVCPLTQAMPHPPQLLGSVWVFVQKRDPLPPHNVCPAEQTTEQVPLEQVFPAGQTMPHWPQLLGSVFVFTHTPLHTVPPAQKEVTQTPLVQVVPALHTVPQAPQLFWSVCSFTQTLPHITWPAGQPDTQTPPVHVPLEHCAADVQAPPTDASPQPPSMQGVPLVQAVPHAPQLEESAEVVVQNPLQEVPEQASVSPAA